MSHSVSRLNNAFTFFHLLSSICYLLSSIITAYLSWTRSVILGLDEIRVIDAALGDSEQVVLFL